MARKSRSSSSSRHLQPNAPEYQHMLHQQPPHNPYYPDPAASLFSSAAAAQPPPPYSQATSAAIHHPAAPMSQLNDISYPRVNFNSPNGARPVVIQAQGVPYDYRSDRLRRKVRSINRQTIILSIIIIVTSLCAYYLHDQRNCVDQFVVHKLDRDIEIKVRDVHNMHYNLALASAFIIILCFLKSSAGYNGKNHSCFLCILALFTFIMTIHAAYLAYLSFYSPCVADLGELASNTIKTLLSKVVDSLPNPEKGYFGEQNVVAMAKRDTIGFLIFILDSLNTLFYFSIFLSSTLLC